MLPAWCGKIPKVRPVTCVHRTRDTAVLLHCVVLGVLKRVGVSFARFVLSGRRICLTRVPAGGGTADKFNPKAGSAATGAVTVVSSFSFVELC